MTSIYIVRHCEAIGNTKRLFQGSSDWDISEIGAKQLEFLARRFNDIKIDAVYSSPLVRARKTALSISEPKGLTLNILDDLREIDGGVIEGRPFAEVFGANAELGDQWVNHPQDFAPAGGEPMRDAYERIWRAICTIVEENSGKSVAVATHGGVIRCLYSRIIGGSIEQLKNMPWSDNTAVSLMEFDKDFECNVRYINDHTHVPDEYMPKRSHISDFVGEKNDNNVG